MFGIAGQYVFGEGVANDILVSGMSESIAHRGPDDKGQYTHGPISIAHRRLSIIDLTDSASQPMKNEDETLYIVFNGEIYNYRELRDELISLGHVFSSSSDTEVILHSYEEWGYGCLERFNGMWAFALWDSKMQSLFCARDRFGIKPFYYAEYNESIIFASEIKALLKCETVGKIPNEDALLTFLARGVADNTNKTMFDGVLQLCPAQYIIIDSRGIHEAVTYWDISLNPEIDEDPDDETSALALGEFLTDSVRLRLRSDVAVGTCLSGGIDSSSITGIINGIIRDEKTASVGEIQKTFSACYHDECFDESRFIDMVIDDTGVDAKRIYPDPETLKNDLSDLIYFQDEPFGSLSIYAQYCVMRLASGHVKVVLDGQGADEQLAGYIGYLKSYISGLFHDKHLLRAFRESLGFLFNHPGFVFSATKQLIVRRSRKKLISGGYPDVNRYDGKLDEVLKNEMISTNLPVLLHYEDRNSMAFSIESRVPFLDYRLVEYISSLPLDQKIRNGNTKFVLRNAMKEIIPAKIAKRKDKMGYVTPEALWMKNELRELVLPVLESDRFKSRKYWKAEEVLHIYRRYLSGKADYSPEIWRIFCTEMWLRKFFEQESSSVH